MGDLIHRNMPQKHTLSAVFEIDMFNIVLVFQDENSADVLPTKKCSGFTAVHLIHFIKSLNPRQMEGLKCP